MTRLFSPALAATLALALTGCGRSAPEPEPTPLATSVLDHAPSDEDVAIASAAARSRDEGEEGAAPGAAALPAAAMPGPPPSFTERDPARVLSAWARGIAARDWRTVRSFWGDNGTRSGLSEAAFAKRWDTLAAPQVTVAPGSQEGAAGSLYYTAPVTITDGKRRITGEVVLRRVNDVDGATPEQLRWHIESTTLKL